MVRVHEIRVNVQIGVLGKGYSAVLVLMKHEQIGRIDNSHMDGFSRGVNKTILRHDRDEFARTFLGCIFGVAHFRLFAVVLIALAGHVWKRENRHHVLNQMQI